MLNDREASKLISKSMRMELDQKEADLVAQHIAVSSSARAFSLISKMIEDSLSDVSFSGSEGLSEQAKVRMRDSILAASQRIERVKTDAGASSAVAETDTLLAMAALEGGLVSEQELINALEEWKPPHPGSLGDYLLEKGCLTESKLAQLHTPLQQQEEKLGSVQGRRDFEAKLSRSPALTRVSLRVQTKGHQVTTSDNSVEDDAPKSRQLVSRFTLIRKLGQGGLGTVWLARDEKLRRNVAIKEMSSTAAENPKAWQRFHREAEITGFLEHPNVVPIYQFGTDPQTSQPFYAMRFVGKRTLSDAILEYHERLKAGHDVSHELRRLLNSFLGVCQAIAYAHSRGVIHRDLKPENVVLDNFGQVIVLDWGLAKLMDDNELGGVVGMEGVVDESYLAQTLDGEVVGTPIYMAPEQAAGDLKNVDERTDVFGLGAILYCILTGQAPHEQRQQDSTSSSKLSDILDVIASQPVRSPREVNPSIESDLEAICLRAISPRRFARHVSVSELAEEIEDWIAGQVLKQQTYSNMRMEGREVRARLQASLADLGINARFMASLPPIQEIADLRAGRTAEDESVWRERLTTIFKGLLQTNRDYSAVGFATVDGKESTEVARVERHSTDFSNVRSIPPGRLLSGPLGVFEESVWNQPPDEVFIDLYHAKRGTQANHRAVVQYIRAGVPVFDQVSEEAFGYIWIECNMQQLIEKELREWIQVAHHIVFLDSEKTIWLEHEKGKGLMGARIGRRANDVCPILTSIVETLELQDEFICERDRIHYGTSLDLGHQRGGLYVVLSQKGRLCGEVK